MDTKCPTCGHEPREYTVMNFALQLIADERQRQIEAEGWTLDHDDKHNGGQMADAAAAYASTTPDEFRLSTLWPWAEHWFKQTPGDRTRELVKAGALIVAEIERIKRLKGGSGR